MTDAELFDAIGFAMYRGNYKGQFADDLQVRLSTVQSWARGSSPVPDGVWSELAALIEARRLELTRLLMTARQRAAKES